MIRRASSLSVRFKYLLLKYRTSTGKLTIAKVASFAKFKSDLCTVLLCPLAMPTVAGRKGSRSCYSDRERTCRHCATSDGMSRLLVEPVQLTQWDTASLDSNLSMTAEQRAEVAARWSEIDQVQASHLVIRLSWPWQGTP